LSLVIVRLDTLLYHTERPLSGQAHAAQSKLTCGLAGEHLKRDIHLLFWRY
jgi:hypothetical protein